MLIVADLLSAPVLYGSQLNTKRITASDKLLQKRPMQKIDLLIRTKLRMPFTRPGLVPRPRLQEQVAEGLHGPLTLVIAPAGFGKTTIAAASLASCAMPAGWLSLDREDNQTGRFLSYLIAALQSADQQIGSDADQLMSGMHQAAPQAVLTSLINDLEAASGELALALDDYQFITSPEVHEAVAFMLEHCPTNFHLLIATRSDPPLPIARLRARGQLVELRAADLRFTAPEAAQFLNDVMGLRLADSSIAALEARTEGWAAGLQMAALSMRDRADKDQFIEGFSGTNRHVLDYLLEEILASQPAEIQYFLLHTSILERLSAALCDAVLALEEPGTELPPSRPSASTLEYLERENLFVVPLDDERAWFRYHHLFADLLQARLQQTQPEIINRLHERASDWLERNGFISGAVRHLFAAREESRAAEMIERYGPAHWAQSDPSIIQMADHLPYDILLANPKLGFYRAWLLTMQGRVEKALPLLEDMARQIKAAPLDPDLLWIRTLVGLALAFLSRPPGFPGFNPLPDYEILDEIPAEELILRDAADILYVMTLGRHEKIERAMEISARCIQREMTARRTQSITAGIQALPSLVAFLGRIYLILGRLHAAADLCREHLGPLNEKGLRFIYSAGSMNIILGEILLEWNCLEDADRQIRDGLQANEAWVDIMSEAFGLLTLTRLLWAVGDRNGALEAVERFENKLQTRMRPVEFQEEFRTLRARTELAFDNLPYAADWADQVVRSEDYQLHPEYYRLTLARTRLAQGRHAEAEEILAKTSSFSKAGNRTARQIEINLLQAAALAGLAGQSRLADALALIEASLGLAEPEGYLRVFLEGGDAVRDLLAAYARADAPTHKGYAQKILGAFSMPGAPGPARPTQEGLVEALSERELEVLSLMALGKTNQEIASQLVVARGTIKAHAANIFRKLDTANRTEAVARARMMGILP